MTQTVVQELIEVLTNKAHQYETNAVTCGSRAEAKILNAKAAELYETILLLNSVYHAREKDMLIDMGKDAMHRVNIVGPSFVQISTDLYSEKFYPHPIPPSSKEEPYLKTQEVVTHYAYNKNYGNDRICKCGHPYYRHFDTYENMEAVGCKYCGCGHFEEA